MPKNPKSPKPTPPRPPKPRRPLPKPKPAPKVGPKPTSKSAPNPAAKIAAIKPMPNYKGRNTPKPGELAALDKAIKAELAKKGWKPTDPNAGVVLERARRDLSTMYTGSQRQKAAAFNKKAGAKRAVGKLNKASKFRLKDIWTPKSKNIK